MTDKKVSVYVNAYNAEKFIKETVLSILNQTYKNLSVVVVDDCSTDSTLKILESIDDSRLKIVALNENNHIANALNEGLKLMDGDYIAHCDADDLWEPEKIEKQVEFLENNQEYGACFTHVSIIDENGNINNDLFPTEVYNISNMSQAELLKLFFTTSNRFAHPAFFARKEIVEKVGLYDVSMPTLHDYDYWLRLISITPVYIFQEPLISVRRHPDNHSKLDEGLVNCNDSERMRILKRTMLSCSDDLFLEAFKEDIRLNGKHTPEETLIEKAFVLEKINTTISYNPVMAVEVLSELLNDPKMSAVAKEKFGFTPKKLYEIERSQQYYKYDYSVDIRINTLSRDFLNIIKQKDKSINELQSLAVEQDRIIQEFQNSFFWRITKVPRAIVQAIKNYAKKHPKLLLTLILTKSFITGGPKAVARKKQDLKSLNRAPIKIPHTISEERRKEEEQYKFNNEVKISILVPLYNTPLIFLKEMIESVQNQTYKNWELCLADGSTEDFSSVGEYCKKAASKDSRIVYKKLEKNEGISGNTNTCLTMATGEYIALFDHDDYLHPSALFKVMKEIENGADYIYTDEVTFLGDDFDKIITCHYKPDFAFDNLIANNYICHFSVFKADLAASDRLFRSEYDGSQDHDLILRLTDKAEKIVHIPEILYFWRSHENSVAMDINSKKYAINAGINAVRDFLLSKGLPCRVESSPAFPTIYRIRYEIKDNPKISVIIPNKNHLLDLKRCIDSVKELSTYENYEIIVIDNQSTDNDVLDYYKSLSDNIKLFYYDEPFNYSAINNFAATKAEGDYLIFLNNDTKVIAPDWMEELLMYAQRGDVGAVGAKLLFENNTIQHGGIILGLGADRIAGHAHYGCTKENLGYMGRLYYAQDVSAVTAACMMVSKEDFNAVGGFNEKLAVAFNDVDFCLKLRKIGKLNIFNPFCTLYHFESISRGLDTDSKNKSRFENEKDLFIEEWGETLEKGDPYYNPNFSLDESYVIKQNY